MTRDRRLIVDNEHVEYRIAGESSRRGFDLVMLHEGLGSATMWKDFPDRLAESTGRRVLVYSRRGYGASSPLSEERTPNYMHEEAHYWLPLVLDRLDIRRPVLFGHSDGASIALIHAAEPTARIAGVVALAPHVKVEPLTITSITEAKIAYETTNLKSRLASYHRDAESVFWSWNRIWLNPAFRSWNIEALLPAIRVPVLAIQGRDDEYGTLEQLESIRRALPETELLILSQCRHSPHRDQPLAVLEATRRFLDRLDRR